MGDGRTPTVTVTGGAAEGVVVFVDAKSTWPFSTHRTQRRRQDRETRESPTGAGRTKRIYRRFNGSEQSLPFQATVDGSEMLILQAISEADPPACTVSYLSGGGVNITWSSAALDDFEWDPVPNGDQDSDGPSEYRVSGTLLRGGLPAS